MIQVYYALLPKPLPDDKLSGYLLSLPVELRAEIGRFKHWEDQHTRLVGKLLLKHGLTRMGFSPVVLRSMRYTDHRRPYLDAPVDFNISHSGPLVACAISRSAKVGIDVEEMRPVDFSNYRDCFGPGEWAVIERAEDKCRQFYHYWTMKEAAAKADGKGLVFPLRQIQLSGNRALIAGQPWHLTQIRSTVSSVMHLAASSLQRVAVSRRYF